MRVCRTCSQNITTKDYFYLDGISLVSNTLNIKDLLQICIPNFDITLFPNLAICRNCVSALHISYLFKTETTKNEKHLQTKWGVQDKIIKIDADSESEQEPEQNDVRVIAGIKNIELVTADLCSDTNDTSINESLKRMHIYTENEIINYADENLQPQESVSNTPIENKIIVNLINEPKATTSEGDNVTSYIQCLTNKSKQKKNKRKPFKCNECDFRSDAKTSLLTHKRVHTGEKPFHCIICPYKGKSKSHLEIHMKMHTGERPYKCSMCDRSFTTKQFLKEHLRIHTGEEPYRCVQCSYVARHKITITNHVKKVHFGVSVPTKRNPSVCSVCGKNITGSTSLAAHMKKHNNIKSLLCELCGKFYRQEISLQSHSNTRIIQKKTYACKKCDYITSQKIHIKEHMRTYGNHLELFHSSKCCCIRTFK